MTRSTHVPQFGKWDANDHIPYTTVFESARAGKGAKLINPNDPYQNPAALASGAIREVINEDPFTDQRYVKESKYNSQPASKNWNKRSDTEMINANRTQGEARYPSQAGVPVRADSARNRLGFGYGQDSDCSPSHIQMYQGRLGKSLGSASPVQERNISSESVSMFATATPGRSGIGSETAETPDRAAAVPKFGAWDEMDPSSAEGFTVVFNQARNKKKSGNTTRISSLQTESSVRFDSPDTNKRQPVKIQQKEPSCWGCCFSSSAKE